jgi:hypothetical protein
VGEAAGDETERGDLMPTQTHHDTGRPTVEVLIDEMDSPHGSEDVLAPGGPVPGEEEDSTIATASVPGVGTE